MQPREEFVARAIALALQGVRAGGGPFGAVVVRGEEIVGEGANRVTSTNDPTAHAEIVAIRAACTRLAAFQLEDCALYTSCEPCPMCLGAVYWARPRAVFFSTTRYDAAAAGFDDAYIYDELPLAPAQRKLPMRLAEHPDAHAPFAAWAAQADRVDY